MAEETAKLLGMGVIELGSMRKRNERRVVYLRGVWAEERRFRGGEKVGSRKGKEMGNKV